MFKEFDLLVTVMIGTISIIALLTTNSYIIYVTSLFHYKNMKLSEGAQLLAYILYLDC